jgi:hypothetical protein
MTLRVYPSKIGGMIRHVRSRYLHSGGGAHLVFHVIGLLLYDRLVERRQKKVMSTAVQSSAIVSSLFSLRKVRASFQ